MAITRRNFLKSTAVAGAALYLGIFDLAPVKAYAETTPPVWTSEAYNICPYCGVGCGMIVGSNAAGQITYVQGDTENPNNLGSLCSKGQNAGQLNHIEGYVRPAGIPYLDSGGNPYKATDSERITTPLRRIAPATNWTAISWDTAIDEIAGLIKTTRAMDSTLGGIDSYMKCTNIAVLGTAKATNEECYLLTKLVRSLGIVYLEHCARL
jgi:anaerobic selenocysteine-containing dehydrogenase